MRIWHARNYMRGPKYRKKIHSLCDWRPGSNQPSWGTYWHEALWSSHHWGMLAFTRGKFIIKVTSACLSLCADANGKQEWSGELTRERGFVSHWNITVYSGARCLVCACCCKSQSASTWFHVHIWNDSCTIAHFPPVHEDLERYLVIFIERDFKRHSVLASGCWSALLGSQALYGLSVWAPQIVSW